MVKCVRVLVVLLLVMEAASAHPAWPTCGCVLDASGNCAWALLRPLV